VRLLSDSAYGRTLLLKLAIATPALVLGAYNRYRLVPTVAEARVRLQLVRSVAIECLLLVAVVGWSAVLANTPPPH
jgi:copper transport protein